MAYLLAEDPDNALRCLDRAVEMAPDADFAKAGATARSPRWRARAPRGARRL